MVMLDSVVDPFSEFTYSFFSNPVYPIAVAAVIVAAIVLMIIRKKNKD